MRRALPTLPSPWPAVVAAVALTALPIDGARAQTRAGADKGGRTSAEWRKLAEATEALGDGRGEEARALVASIPVGRLPKGSEDDYAFLKAMLADDGAAHVAALEEYLKLYPRGPHRRQATLALGRARYVRGEYSEAENVLSIFSPGVEKDFIGRQALVQRGLAQLARGDAVGALAFFRSAQADLAGTPQEEAYYFAVSQAAIRASKPAEAIEALRRLLERHAKSEYGPQALYAMALSLEAVGRPGDAAGVFRQVMVRYPNSYEATRARDRGIRVASSSSPAFPLGGGFVVQVGAFSRRELAEALARDLKLAGVDDVSVKQGTETPTIFRVRAGAFSTRDEARALGERLRRERGFSYTIAPR
ncbi:MAG TPA: SPOR domain-containing protein [Candidatus Eisenbacteria bacterium]|nr:SPOR domain-containing protein [Candidatus Eisenbacteria bacterium]